jgi:demethylmenaquinone methyltransferase/2-methoxy-6-polyprenyl-1,4-benzoquinol methylase
MTTHTPLPLGDEKKQMVQQMFDDIAPTYEKANRFISFGLDNYARRIAMKELRITPGSIVIDLASGTGDFSRMLSREAMTPVACDLSYGMLHNDSESQLRVQCDGTHLPFGDESVDAVVCGYALRNFVDLNELFPEIMRVLKPQGRFVAVDVTVPSNPVLKAGNKLWFARIAPKLGWLISKNKKAYEYLPRSTAYLPDRETLMLMLEKASAENINITPLIGGSLALISATKPRVAS